MLCSVCVNAAITDMRRRRDEGVQLPAHFWRTGVCVVGYLSFGPIEEMVVCFL
jgi:hypothetical protein